MLLVTGATGCVGAALLALPRERGLPTRVTVRSGERARSLPPDVPWVVAELVGSPHRVSALPAGSSLGPDCSTFASRSEVYGKLGPVRVLDPTAMALGFAPTGLADGLAETAAWLAPPR